MGTKSDIQGGPYGNETDILYWFGHGLKTGIMSWYDNYGYYHSYNENSFNGVDTVGNSVVSWDYYNGYKTNSLWDYDLDRV